MSDDSDWVFKVVEHFTERAGNFKKSSEEYLNVDRHDAQWACTPLNRALSCAKLWLEKKSGSLQNDEKVVFLIPDDTTVYTNFVTMPDVYMDDFELADACALVVKFEGADMAKISSISDRDGPVDDFVDEMLGHLAIIPVHFDNKSVIFLVDKPVAHLEFINPYDIDYLL